jgi:gamma-glutamyltranspeptidase
LLSLSPLWFVAQVSTVQKEGGTLSMEDLAEHHSDFVEALSMEYVHPISYNI